MDNDDKKLEIDVSWTLNDCEWTTGPAWQKFELDSNSDYNTDFTYTSPALEISSVPDLFADFDDEILRDKYPELMAAWQQYQNLLAKYRMWDNVTNPPEDPPF